MLGGARYFDKQCWIHLNVLKVVMREFVWCMHYMFNAPMNSWREI